MARAAAISVGLYTFHNFVDAAASYPAGALGDRIGKRGLLAIGYMVGAASYGGFIFARPKIPVLVVLFGLAGIHDAFQQSLEKSLAAELLPRERARHGLRRPGDGERHRRFCIQRGGWRAVVVGESRRPDFYTRGYSPRWERADRYSSARERALTGSIEEAAAECRALR